MDPDSDVLIGFGSAFLNEVEPGSGFQNMVGSGFGFQRFVGSGLNSKS